MSVANHAVRQSTCGTNIQCGVQRINHSPNTPLNPLNITKEMNMATKSKTPLKYRIIFKIARLFGYKATVNTGLQSYPNSPIIVWTFTK